MRKKKEKITLTPLEQLKALVGMTVVTSQQQKEERDEIYRSLLDTIIQIEQPKPVQVVHPDYYRQGEKETIDVICDALTPMGAYLFSRGNIIKYRDRAPYKEDFWTDHAKIKEYEAFAAKYRKMLTPSMRRHWMAIKAEWKEIQHEGM